MKLDVPGGTPAARGEEGTAVVVPEDVPRNQSPDERPTLRRRLSRHYNERLDGSGRGAVLSALIGLVTALLGAVVAIYVGTRGDDRNAPPDARPSAGASSPADAPPVPTSPAWPSPTAIPSPTAVPSTEPGPITAAPSDGGVRWSGEVRFATYGVDLDTVPATVQRYWSTDADLSRDSASADDGLHAEWGQLALWPGPGTPSRQQCAERVSTHGAERVHIPVGRIGCLTTNKDHVAMFKVTRYPDDSFQVTAHVTVWTPPGDS
ncbi:hypothetical protein [Micromonospora sp. RL09-050-HVF-A]|uniref:hypothetical protein n=1 Tax=Micromonospora sp. RL09-050-HVF-A TaxID=1703433 RepID=UPI001C5FD064|nr:hypothetical protein [Micromonospora sp. RL09-050-HVF-A]MBW4703354.1 hypothetical protein [Micromonospora sp. RL09-050-HVF-A]